MANNDRLSEGQSSPPRSGGGFLLHPLHEAAIRIAELSLSRPKAKTRDLVALLVTHGARAWRSSQPEARIHLHVAMHAGRRPVHLRIY